MPETSAGQDSQIFATLKKLPYKKWWFWLIVAVVLRLLVMAYENAQSPVFDAQALGFPSEQAMQEAFAKGYHTRQKMEEMARFYAEVPKGPVPSVASTSSVAFAPSFDCSKATSAVNKIICSDRELSELDLELSAEYKSAIADQNDPSGLIENQRDWLKNTINDCQDKPCIVEAYKNRIAELQAGD